MFEVFAFYITIFETRMHLLSLILTAFSFFIGLYLQRGRFNILDKVMHSLLLVQIGNFLYELIWMLFYAMAGDDLNSFILYSIVFSFLVLICVYFNKQRHFSKINRNTYFLFSGLILCFLVMQVTGWFIGLRQYDLGLGVDPHNTIWAISKLLGFLIPVSTLET